GARPDASLRVPAGDGDAVRSRQHGAMHGVLELDLLGAWGRSLLADRRSALRDLERLCANRHPPPAAAVAVPARVLRIDPLDVVVDLLADVARDERPGVVVAPADTGPGTEPRHREARAVPARRVLPELPEDRRRALARLWRAEQECPSAARAPAAAG